MVIGAYLPLDGLALVGLGLSQRRHSDPGRGWQVASGVIDLMLASVIPFMSAISSAVVAGLSLPSLALLVVHRSGAAQPPLFRDRAAIYFVVCLQAAPRIIRIYFL